MKPLMLFNINYGTYRNFCSAVRSFSEIPSPPAYPFLGHSYLFSKNGPYSREKLTEAALDLSQKYGPIFRIKLPGNEFVVTVDAENGAKVFQNEGKYPHRLPMLALAHYHQKTFGTTGIVSGNGSHWYRLRKALIPLLTKSYIRQYEKEHNEIAETFVSYIRKTRNQDKILSDILAHLFKYTIECISIVSPGKRLHCLLNKNDTDVAAKIIKGSSDFLEGLYLSLSEPPIWKFMKTKGYKLLESGFNAVDKYVDEQIQSPVDAWKPSFMKLLFENPNLSVNEARLLSAEVFLGGIDTMATTLAMTLYYLSKDKHRQAIASEDINNDSHSYLKACLKEAMRLSPPAGGTTRSLPVDVVMNGYHVPAQSVVIVYHSATSVMEKYFDDAHLFKPERWLNINKHLRKHKFTPFASLPFGHGPRVCPGKWLSEQESLCLLIKILKAFHLECCTKSNVNMIYRMNRIPDQPINIRFDDKI